MIAPMIDVSLTVDEHAQASRILPMKVQMRRARDQAVVAALALTNGNRTQAAKLLGIHRSWLYTILTKMGIRRVVTPAVEVLQFGK